MTVATGLLILTSQLAVLPSKLNSLIVQASKHVSKTLYVQVEAGRKQLWPVIAIDHGPSFRTKCFSLISDCYVQSYQSCYNLDVRVLLGSMKATPIREHKTWNNIDVVLVDRKSTDLEMEGYLTEKFSIDDLSKVPVIELEMPNEEEATNHVSSTNDADWSVYDYVILGGTFDRLHSAHKTLLSAALLKCEHTLTIGVTCGSMITSKRLWELIQPVEQRMQAIREFIAEVDPSVNYVIEKIDDPYGPAVSDPRIKCIVVSEETIPGANRINQIRSDKNFCKLDIYPISLLPDLVRHTTFEEDKISSSSFRMRVLGRRLNLPSPKPHLPLSPYLIGLTGGIASGKSSIAGRLENLGAGRVDCDKLGHLAYQKGSKLLNALVEEFGGGVLTSDGEINRKALGAIVFSDPTKLKRLNALVWPEILNLARTEVAKHSANGKDIIVLEAAILLEAGWDYWVHEVWAAFIPKDAALERIMNRDHITEEQANQRINSQMPNDKRIQNATSVFCTLWETDYTQKQVERAWKALQDYLKTVRHQ